MEILQFFSDLHYILFPDNENVLNCVVSSSFFCTLDIALHLVNKVWECSYFLFENCQISFLNQTRDQSFSIDKNFRDIAMPP